MTFNLPSSKRRRRNKPATFRIEGSDHTIADIAARLGMDASTAARRLRNAQKIEGPVTWERIAAEGMGAH